MMQNIEEKELDILKNAVSNIEKIKDSKKMQSPEIKNILIIVEKFIKQRKLICYGGTAINNILPTNKQFYDKDIELPDYDVFSPTPIKHVIQLSKIYKKNGYNDIEAKSGMHYGTYKLYVNFIPILDITHCNKKIFTNLKKESIMKNCILNASPNFLRMSMYQELSRPKGDTTRWEKVLKRLNLLNNAYPIVAKKCNTKTNNKIDNIKTILNIIKDYSIKNKLVFFGEYAVMLYGKHMSTTLKNKYKNYSYFDVLSKNGIATSNELLDELKKNNINNVEIKMHKGIDEIVPIQYELSINNQPLIYIYETMSCYSYNTIKVSNKKVNIASIDTIFSLYLIFLYLNRDYYDKNKILCTIDSLFKLQRKNRLKTKGLLKRFGEKCYGSQESFESIKSIKAKMYKKLKTKKNKKEFKKWFLKYKPKSIDSKTKKTKKTKTKKIKTKNKTKKINKSKSKK